MPEAPKDNFVNFYNPNSPEVKRLDSKAEDFQVREAQLKQQGWSRQRFAKMLYHKRQGAKVFRTSEDVAKALKQGWLENPITDPKDAVGAHKDAVHSHHNDEHRQAFLAEQKSA